MCPPEHVNVRHGYRLADSRDRPRPGPWFSPQRTPAGPVARHSERGRERCRIRCCRHGHSARRRLTTVHDSRRPCGPGDEGVEALRTTNRRRTARRATTRRMHSPTAKAARSVHERSPPCGARDTCATRQVFLLQRQYRDDASRTLLRPLRNRERRRKCFVSARNLTGELSCERMRSVIANGRSGPRTRLTARQRTGRAVPVPPSAPACRDAPQFGLRAQTTWTERRGAIPTGPKRTRGRGGLAVASDSAPVRHQSLLEIRDRPFQPFPQLHRRPPVQNRFGLRDVRTPLLRIVRRQWQVLNR